MGNYYYKTTPVRRKCKTICIFNGKRVGSLDCKNTCPYHNGYGYDIHMKYVICEKLGTKNLKHK